MASTEETYDYIIVGSGAGSGPAALLMKSAGKRPLIIEKEPLIGGTSAYSGGMMWMPNHGVGGVKDSPEAARAYMDAVTGDDPNAGSTPARRDAYIEAAPEMIRYLEGRGIEFVPVEWPDYFPEAPGAHNHRTLQTNPFDLNKLGKWGAKMAGHPLMTTFPITARDAVPLGLMKRSWRGKLVMASVIWRQFFWRGLLRQKYNGGGNALQGRIYEIVLREQIPIWTDTKVVDFIVENDRVFGVVAERDGETIRVRSELGVLLNAGGFARNQAMRDKYQPQPSSTGWTWVNPGHTGEMIEAAQKLGARIDLMDESFWLLSSFDTDGTQMGQHSPNDICRPGVILVNQQGKRFANEAENYMLMGQHAYKAGAVPAWAIFDANARNNYTWGMMPPGLTPKKYIDSGYLKKSDTLDGLAAQCGIDPAALKATVQRFNGFCKTGVDEDFHRGDTVYDRHYGDPSVKPNPNLGPVGKAPFYAVRIVPGDVGTAGGVVCDENSRVLREDGSVIQGLYATGITTATVAGRNYFGAGCSVGPSAAFGWIAARHAARPNAAVN